MSEQSEPADVPEWDVADRMRKALRHAGMTPGQMAAYLGVGGNTVSTWINGRIAPSTQTLRLWALRCGVPYDWLADTKAQVRDSTAEGSMTKLSCTTLTLAA